MIGGTREESAFFLADDDAVWNGTLTEAELRERLAAAGIEVSKSRVGQVLRRMGLGRKKNRSMPSNETAQPTSSGARSSSKPSARSRQRSSFSRMRAASPRR